MNETIRIRTVPNGGDKYIKVPIKQDFDVIKILSLKISQDDVYPRHCADYGILVGRVSVNGGFGVPNAKVSIFIPLSAEDEENPVIAGTYPYKTAIDKDSNGVRYNLLPKLRRNKCHVPVGTFPNKREVLDNDDVLEVFEKYYKYTTTTNVAGDYMICGIPVGQHQIHVDVDLSDIGTLSQRPHDMIRQGHSKNSFATPTKFKYDTDLGKLPQIITENSGVDIMPFWGDEEMCNVGINRYDVALSHKIEPVAYFIGSVFGDSEKNSVNKHCRARRAVGDMCSTVTGEGKIEMIRRTLGGQNEYVTADSQMIDGEGTWVVPVPMNLDYYVTDEYGTMVLSENPNKGVPTRARVRFRIGMNNTGDEGRLRTRAKFLVPNNPPTFVQGDYTFDETTRDMNNNFTEMTWNNIYTVRNFIPRVQRSRFNAVERRTFIGIKNVDDCTDYNEFPYNRMDSALNPLYRILCTIMTLIIRIIWVFNLIIVPILNFVFWAINRILSLICGFIWWFTCTIANISIVGWYPLAGFETCICTGDDTCDGTDCSDTPDCCGCMLAFVPPMTISCEETDYAPGYEVCTNGQYANGPDFSCSCPNGDDPTQWCVTICPPTITSLSQTEACLKNSLADALNVYKFDFYNDWINGALYSFLFKFKQRRNGKVKYCAYDCEDSDTPAYHDASIVAGSGDGDGDGVADNSCWRTYTFDNCPMSEDAGCMDESEYIAALAQAIVPGLPVGGSGCEDIIGAIWTFDEGLIKRKDGYLYYASTNHAGNIKLFATDVTLLGNINECNLKGTPVIYQHLIPTTYQLPPLAVNEGGGLVGDPFQNGTLSLWEQNYGEDGVTSIDPLLLTLTCNGAALFRRHCRNLRLLCELGRGLDEDRFDLYDPTLNTQQNDDNQQRNGLLDSRDIENEYVRKALRHMNVTGLSSAASEDEWHASFRGFNNTPFGFGDAEGHFMQGFSGKFPTLMLAILKGLPYNNSYYFYFGLHAGKTALDRLLNDYLTDCDFPKTNDFFITYDATNVTTFNGHDGTINITPNGGTGPYTATVTTTAGVVINSPIIFDGDTDITSSYAGGGLPAGVYTITVVDTNGWTSTITVTIDSPPGMSYGITPVNLTGYTCGCGEINVNYIYGGTPDYTITLVGPFPSNASQVIPCPGLNCSYVFENLAAGDYTLTVSDSSSPTQTLSQVVTLTEPPVLSFDPTTIVDCTCYGQANGIIAFHVIGGTPPYTITTVGGPSNYTFNDMGDNGLLAGTYTSTVTDANGQVATTQVTINQPPQFTLSSPTRTLYNGYHWSCYNGTNGEITLTVNGGTPPYTYYYLYQDSQNVWAQQSSNVLSNIPVSRLGEDIQFKAKDANDCTTDVQRIKLYNRPPEVAVPSVTQFTTGVDPDPILNWARISNGQGGCGGYSYRIVCGGYDVTQSTTDFNVTSIVGGSATAYVTDANGCSRSTTFTVS